MAQIIVKSYPSNVTSIVPELFHSFFVIDPGCSLKNMGDMVITWVNIEDDREIVDAIFDEDLKNIGHVSTMYIDVYV